MFCIDVPCGEPEQKRPPPTVKAALSGSGQPDLNRRPRRPERRALPGCAMPRLNCRHVYRADFGSRSGSTPSRILSTCPWQGVQWLSTRLLRIRNGEFGMTTGEESNPFASLRNQLYIPHSQLLICHCPNSSYIASMRVAWRSSMTLRRSLSVGVNVPSSTVNGSASRRKLRIFSYAAASRL